MRLTRFRVRARGRAAADYHRRSSVHTRVMPFDRSREDVTHTMPSQPEASANNPDDAIDIDPGAADVGPSDAEIENWAQHERERREAWLRGPTQAQRADWAVRERGRRLSEHGPGSSTPRVASGERLFLVQRYAREAQLAAEGAVSMVLGLSMREVFDQLVQAGRDWEDEYASRPVRRRIPLGEDASRSEGGSTRVSESPGTASQTS
jgi:hypothetical protein